MVNFVGAGPGAADLITLRGKSLLEKADAVIYAGSLVNPELLKYTKKECRIYNSARMCLEEVVEVIKDAEDSGEMTVRLHTGDPSVYGAIREQMDILDKLDIEYSVCPGVSSFCGAAAALKAEYTLPGVSQTVILTRLAGRTAVPEKESIESLASHNASMAVFLSCSMAGELSKRLIAGGYASDTPAAVVYKATWRDEKIVRGTVAELEGMTADIKKTALIVVGEFLGEDYEFSKLYDKSFTTEFRKGEQV